MSNLKNSVHKEPGLLGGVPVFTGTRVPVRILFEHLIESNGIDVFLKDFPGVTREQVMAVLEFSQEAVDKQSPHSPRQPPLR
jgi:uncharacterized protein (DUF433 family)